MSGLTAEEERTMTREQKVQAFMDREGDDRQTAELMVDILAGNMPADMIGHVD